MADDAAAADRNALWIAGASVRAAAQSAVRAGYRVYAADLFADQDLRRCAAAQRVERYPSGLLEAAQQLPSMPWFYTGGLENAPQLLHAVSRRHRLCGVGPDVLRVVRDPLALADLLARAGWACPTVRPGSHPPHRGPWLRKPVRGCGGTGIEHDPGAAAAASSGGPARCDGATGRRGGGGVYLQRLVSGQPCGVAYVAAAGSAVLLGVTRQLIGCSWAGSGGYQYVGSVGPLRLSGEQRCRFEQLGNDLAAAAGLVGLFGVDVVVQGDHFWILEVNPRYCASLEVLERALGFPAVALHMEACLAGRLPARPAVSATPLHGKAVLYAPRPLVVTRRWLRRASSGGRCGPFPAVADIPDCGTRVAVGRPVLTVFARGPTLRAVVAGLRGRATMLLNAG